MVPTSRFRLTIGSPPAGLGTIPKERHGEEVAIVGAGGRHGGGYELMKMGLKPVIYKASKMGGRLRSQVFEGTKDVVAELAAWLSGIQHGLLPLRGHARPEKCPLPQPADARLAQHRD